MPAIDGHPSGHCAGAIRQAILPSSDNTFRVKSRRWFLQTGLAGLAGLSLADTLRVQAETTGEASARRDPKSVILFWRPIPIVTGEGKPIAELY